jgi:hypothetical protein
MRRNNIFWGLLILIIGILLLLSNLGILTINIWSVLWPLGLILLGAWFLLGPRMARTNQEVANLSLALESCREAEVTINHGAGRLEIGPGAESDVLLSGRFEGGLERTYSQSGDLAKVKLSLPADIALPFTGWGYHNGFLWQIALNPEVSYSLRLNTGAGDTRLDLTNLSVSAIRVDTGASNTEVLLPESCGETKVDLHGGANSVKLHVPQNVAARIQIQAVLSGVDVDTTRFPKMGGVYQSSDYATALNRVDVKFEGGVGSIDVH